MAHRRPAPAYPYPERSYASTNYPPTASRNAYTSPRTSGERVSKGLTTLAAVESYDKYGRKISSTAGPAYDPRLSSSGVGGGPSRRLSLITPRAPERYAPDVTYAPQSGPRAPETYDRSASHHTPVSSTGLRGSHNRHSSSIDDAYRSRVGEERSREPSYDPPRRRRESIDQLEPRANHRGYNRHAPPRRSELDERTSYEYGSSKDRPISGAPYRRDRSESFEGATRERPKNLAIEYPGYKPPPSASRGLDRISGMSRAESQRNRGSPPRPIERERRDSASDTDPYQVARRPRPQSEYNDRSAMLSPTRQRFDESSRQPRRSHDPDIGNRGFGLRAPSPASRDADFDKSRAIPAGMISQREYRDDTPRDDGYRRSAPQPRPRQTSPEYARESKPSRETSLDRTRNRPGPRERDTYSAREDRPPRSEAESHPVDRQHERDTYSAREDRPPRSEAESRPVDRQHEHARSRDKPSAKTDTAVAAGGGLAALAAGQYASRRHDDSDDSDDAPREERTQPRDRSSARREPSSFHSQENIPLPSRNREESPTEERQPPKERESGVPAEQAPATNDDEDDYQSRLQRMYEGVAQAKPGATPAAASKEPQQPREPERRRERSSSPEDSPPREVVRGKRSEVPRDEPRDESPPDADAPQALTSYRPPEVEDDHDHYLEEEYSAEPSEMPTSPTLREKRVAIVDPPKEEKKPKGILKTRSVPFPDYPEEPKEGARPHKTAKVEGAPEDATLTKLPRSVYSTEILDEYGERYTTYNHEVTGAKMICVLRVVDKDTLKKYEQKSKDLREGRHKDHRRHKDRSSKDKDDEEDDSRRHRKHRHRSSSSRSKREDDVGDEEDDNSDYDDDREKSRS